MNVRPYLIIYVIVTSVILLSFILQWPDQNLHLTACDVGQGDSYIITKGFSQILIDAGKDYQVVSCLDKSLPYWDRQIDIVIASHDDHDHIGGLIDVFQRFKVKRLIWNGKQTNSTDWLAIMREAQIQQTVVQENFKNNLQLNNINVLFLWPINRPIDQAEDNPSSVIAKITYHEFSALFSGDIDTLTEEKLISARLPLQSQLLKVAHHGSKNSTSDKWLQIVNPQIAIIGVGKNSYGHPTEEVLQRLEQQRVKVFRTDKDGLVQINSDGQNWWINNDFQNMFLLKIKNFHNYLK